MQPARTLGTHPACHSRQSHFLGHGVAPAAACPGYEKLPSVPVLAGEPHLGSPRACSCCRIQPSWKQEADLAQPLVGPTVPLDGAASPVMEQQGKRLGRAGAFPKKA